MNVFSWIFGYAGAHKKRLRIVGALAAVGALLEPAPYIILYFFVINLVKGGGAENPTVYAAAVFAAITGKALIRWFVGVEVHSVGYHIVYEIRTRLAEHMGGLPVSFFNRQNAGTLHKAVMEDAERVETLFCHNLPDVISAIVTPLFCLIIMFVTDWRLALFALAPFPLAVGCQVLMMRECTRKMGQYHNAMAAMNAGVQEYVRGMVTVRAFNRTAFSFKSFFDSVTNFHVVVADWSRSAAKYYALFETALGAGLLFVLPPGLWLLFRGRLELPDLVLFLMLVVGYAQPLDKLLSFASKLREIEEGVRRMDAVLQEPRLEAPASPRQPDGHDIVFDHVTFGHTGEAPLFSDLSLHIQENAVTAFVGPSGAGKTTAALLMARYQDVCGGAVRIGGVDVRDMTPETLMRQMSLVFQDTFLFSASLLENIRCAKPEASTEEVAEAARKAHAFEFIQRLPGGWDTPAGEGGTPLSGGERQRIAIARAILRDAPIVILDEATAYADPETEVLIQDSLATLLQGKTVIVIAHNLPTICQADSVVLFDAGKVTDIGTHGELLERCGLYKTLWHGREKAQDWGFGKREQKDGGHE